MTKLLGWLALAATSVALTLTLALGTHVASVSADSEKSGNLQIEKNCSAYTGQAGSYCTIKSSNVPEIPAKTTRVFYDQAYGIPDPVSPGMLDSNVVLYVGNGNWAVGRCTLDPDSLGLCTFSDGVGPLTGFHARINVSPAPGVANYYWNGTYSFRPPSD
jgi:hypothetical protein